jgi:hypothetical protein
LNSANKQSYPIIFNSSNIEKVNKLGVHVDFSQAQFNNEKDPYSLPFILKKLDAIIGYEISFFGQIFKLPSKYDSP